ncbi:Nitrilase/cyanide hydratase and apolipoprotein N-acyltransferase [Rhodopseudomonas palustris TIE-1]|uniref:carbon-nitrogen hydrolase family protein n=1 Tax=Rhodopseudomonas palustris TaxID=1076 RepID=UPI000164B376|nr:carbon-nitrogen hydrolase family protein [Rhodopseudomonas palustris]ACF02365.1 Nitrilase/cyanide hydratase and apolipoprotein N-acyltransferase [Rhodopseudomonas palustris TIE-1]
MTKRRFRAAAVQTLAKLGDFEFNIALATRYVEDAVRQGAELIVFPECMDTGYLFDSPEHCRELAETLTDGPFVKALAALSRKHGVYIASGITEWDPAKQKIFNTGIMFDRQGEVACHYHKQFLATHDQNWFAFGERGCPVVDTDLGKIGLLICFDGRIPEIFRAMTMQGAEVIVDMANFFAMDQADMWGPARSYENGVWLVAATKAGYERSIYYPGGSMIVDPEGRVLSKVPYDTHGLSIATIDLDAAADKSIYTANDKIADRRPETYGIMALPYEKTPVYGVADRPLIPSKSVTKVAAVQIHVTPDCSVAEVLDMVDHTAKLGAKVITLPEYAFSAQYILTPAEAASAADQAAANLAAVAKISARYGCLIAAPIVERAAAGLYVTTVLIGPDGKEIGRYRKTHLTAEERKWAVAGFDYPVFDTPFGRIGVMSGYDAVFPETSRCLAIGAADIILWPAALREPFERDLLAVPRAEDNRVAVVLANRVDSPYPGGSVVIPPTGFPQWDINIAAPRVMKLGAVMPKHIDLAVCRQKMMIPKVDMFANRLVETYAPIVAA